MWNISAIVITIFFEKIYRLLELMHAYIIMLSGYLYGLLSPVVRIFINQGFYLLFVLVGYF